MFCVSIFKLRFKIIVSTKKINFIRKPVGIFLKEDIRIIYKNKILIVMKNLRGLAY